MNKSKNFNIWNLLTWTITFVLLVLTGLMLISKINIKDSFQTLLVQSGSMEPIIKTGDLVIVKPNKNYLSGDIITFYNSENKKVTHRIVNIRNENGVQKIFTKGDANKVIDDGYISSKQIIGKVNRQIPYLGKLVFFSKTFPGLIILIFIPAIFIILGELKKIGKNLGEILSF
jgi:signal peptidase